MEIKTDAAREFGASLTAPPGDGKTRATDHFAPFCVGSRKNSAQSRSNWLAKIDRARKRSTLSWLDRSL